MTNLWKNKNIKTVKWRQIILVSYNTQWISTRRIGKICPRKPTLWTLRKVSIQISISMSRRLIRTDTLAFCGFSVSGIITLYLHPLRRKVSARIRLCALRRLIWVDSKRRVHHVCFLVERLICTKPDCTSVQCERALYECFMPMHQ